MPRLAAGRTERLALLGTVVAAGAFAVLVGVAHAEDRCREVAETWSLGAERGPGGAHPEARQV